MMSLRYFRLFLTKALLLLTVCFAENSAFAAQNDSLVVIARLSGIPGTFAPNDLYDYTYMMKYTVVKVVHGVYAGREILVGHYNPLIPRGEIRDKMAEHVSGNIRKFTVGDLHRLVLIAPVESVWKGAVDDEFFDSPIPKYFAVSAHYVKESLSFRQLHERWDTLADERDSGTSLPAKTVGKTAASPVKTPPDKTASVDTVGKKILLLTGDSMAGCLLNPLSSYCKAQGIKVVEAPFICSTTDHWADRKFMTRLIKKHQPFFIIIALGSNEYYLAGEGLRKRIANAQSILAETGAVPLVWVGPPDALRVQKFDAVLLEALGNGRYFTSSGLTLDRKKDNRHPSIEAGGVWSDTVARWIQHTSQYRQNLLPAGSPQSSMYARSNYAAIARKKIMERQETRWRRTGDSIFAENAKKTMAGGSALFPCLEYGKPSQLQKPERQVRNK